MKFIFKLIHLFLFMTIATNMAWSQLKKYSFEELESLEIKKPTVVFLHTNWCKYCQVMEHTTFTDKKVISKLNKDYHFISFDAEQAAPITFQNHTFKYKSTGKKTGIHELAEALGTYKFKITYPTTVVLNSKKEIIFQYPSVLKPKGFLRMLEAIEDNEKTSKRTL